MNNFKSINYLSTGSTIQQRVYQLLIRYRIMEQLQEFQPVLAGTFPINIAIQGSDLDILCFAPNLDLFRSFLNDRFGDTNDFAIAEVVIRGESAVIANFSLDEFEIEIFGQQKPVEEQNGYRHMLIEHEILNERGEAFRLEIVKLKQQGIKTEPAFAQLLELDGDPYEALLLRRT